MCSEYLEFLGKSLNVPECIFECAENLISSKCIWHFSYRLKDYIAQNLLMFILPFSMQSPIFLYSFDIFFISWRSSSLYSGIRMLLRDRRKAMSEVFFIKSILASNMICVLQNTNQSHCSDWGKYFSDIFNASFAFILELFIHFFFRSESSLRFHELISSFL